jgi:enolase-phosphatase E1
MIQAIITDVEGTTTSLSFVKEILFPYARERLGNFIHQHAKDPQIAPLLEATRAIMGNSQVGLEAIITQLHAWSDADVKITALKSLQGLLWEEGYRRSDFVGHVYPDAERNLRAWRARGLRLYVFSSGSVQAQKLLFTHTAFGDLTPLFEGHFDTHIGAKQEVSAYQRIAEHIGIPSEGTLFLSDVKEELAAATEAGMNVIWLCREGKLDTKALYRQVRDFDAVQAYLTQLPDRAEQ